MFCIQLMVLSMAEVSHGLLYPKCVEYIDVSIPNVHALFRIDRESFWDLHDLVKEHPIHKSSGCKL